MRSLRIMALLLVVVLIVAACGGKAEGPKGPKKVYYPDWWQLQDSPEYVQTYGMAEKINQNTSYDAAYANAMLQAAQYVESYVKGMVKNYQEEAGVEDPTVTALTSSVVKVVSNSKFANAMVTKQETIIIENDRYKTFVRVSIPKESINENLVDKIKKEEALYNAFKASQSFKELDEELEKY
ncbi:MAG: hypothetical protein SVM86_02810 [Candidatus Cloacimonadota bacterium]|nr:hypothetical protein [Candidatus Cloacimonadota bacterium]